MRCAHTFQRNVVVGLLMFRPREKGTVSPQAHSGFNTQALRAMRLSKDSPSGPSFYSLFFVMSHEGREHGVLDGSSTKNKENSGPGLGSTGNVSRRPRPTFPEPRHSFPSPRLATNNKDLLASLGRGP